MVSGPDDEGQWASESADAGHPVLAGLAALTAVALVVGIVLGLGVLTVTKVVGLGGSGTGSGEPGGATMYLPETEATTGVEDPPTSLEPGESAGPATATESGQDPAEQPITLVGAPLSVGSFGRIDLTGDYPTGNGAILQVQRREGGKWVEFAVTTAVNGESFATYVQTSRSGPNLFRVIDSDTGLTSNSVTVRVR